MMVSVILPCLNEAQTVGVCVEHAKKGIKAAGCTGEVIVVDNGSTDGSPIVARTAGARVVTEKLRGYGNALQTGLAGGRGDILIFGDCDGTHDFSEIPEFIRTLSSGYDCVIGSRIKGTIKLGAMPWTHRYIGIPLLSRFLSLLFRSTITDTLTGFRACRRNAYKRMRLRTTGMEFASEFTIAALQNNLRITEIPITYYPRRVGKSKLHALQDGLRHAFFIARAKFQSI